MTDQPGRELGLGHLGQASYDTEQHSWSHNRQHSDAPKITWLCEPVNLIASDQDASSNQAYPLQDNAVFIPDVAQPRRVSRDEGQSRLGLSDSHRRDEGISRAIAQSLSAYDPLKGDLLVSGSFIQRFEDGHAKSLIPFVLLAGGPGGDQLRLLASDEVRYMVEAETSDGSILERSLTAHVPGLEQARWVGPGVAVQQICLSHVLPAGEGLRTGLSQNTLAAARLRESTLLFRIGRGGRHGAMSSRRMPRSAPSASLDVLMEIDLSHTYARTHADVTFNPWFNQQVAIADHAGHVSILDYDWSKTDHRYAITATQSISRTLRSNEARSDFLHDGWARVIWAADVSTIAIAVRHELRIINITSSESLSVPKLGLNSSANWILDMRRHPINLNHLLLLTNTRIYWLRVLSRRQDGTERSMILGGNLLLSARHFRDVSDVTMQMAVTAQDETTSIFVTSKLNTSMTSFHFRTPAESPDEPIALGAPINFMTAESLGNRREMHEPAQQVMFLPVSTANPMDQPAKSNNRGGSSSVSQVMTLQQDLSVRQTFMCINHGYRRPLSETLISLDLESAVRTKLLKNKSSHRILPEDEDDFVLPDNYVPKAGRSEHSRSAISRVNAPIVKADRFDNSPRFRFPRRAYTSLFPQRGTGAESENADLDQDGVGHLTTILEDAGRFREDPMSTLFELSNPFEIDDIDALSKALDQLLEDASSSLSDGTRVHLDNSRVMRFMQHLRRSCDGPQQLSQVYDLLVETYLRPLSKKTPGRYRIGLNRELRSLASDVVLAATVASVLTGEATDEVDAGRDKLMLDALSTEIAPIETIDIKYPISSRAASVAPESSMSQTNLDQQSSMRTSYPTPAFSQASVPPSPYFPPTPTSSVFETATAQANSEARHSFLSRFVAFSAPPPPLRSATNRILSHWSLGENPTDYDYTAQQALLDRARNRAEEEELQRGMSGKARRRLARRAERASQRLVQQSQSQQMQSLQTPFAATQPTLSSGASAVIRNLFTSTQGTSMDVSPVPAPVTMSSQLQPSMQLASQREPGKFGGRPPARKKAKLSGFR